MNMAKTKAKPKRKEKPAGPGELAAKQLLGDHFAPRLFDALSIAERKFPFRVRADLQRAVDRLFAAGTAVERFTGIRKEYAYEGLDFPAIITDANYPAVAVPPQYEEVDVGDDQPVRCLKNGLWLLRRGTDGYAVLLTPTSRHGEVTGVTFQIATANDGAGAAIAGEFFRHLEESVLKAESYRGKILSLEGDESYSGRSTGIRVHKLRAVEREQVILPRPTLDLLDRNVVGFVRNRPRLAHFRQSTKKGVLFYGPPGTGKTHTIHYLAGSLPGHTTLLISAEQVAHLGEYMTLARLLQPSMIVIEDVDLIARDRDAMHGPCEEALLNKLLNEMDGLREDADILFVLTTNRPEALEAALASRPGRVDQAIEFPLPDDEGRGKLVALYSRGVRVPDDVAAVLVKRTDGVSAAFIKELMRRSVQFHVERADTGEIGLADVDSALDEMLFSGGSLNRKLLGGAVDGDALAAVVGGGRNGSVAD
jgi:AAA+ superfamily predicted ATPase